MKIFAACSKDRKDPTCIPPSIHIPLLLYTPFYVLAYTLSSYYFTCCEHCAACSKKVEKVGFFVFYKTSKKANRPFFFIPKIFRERKICSMFKRSKRSYLYILFYTYILYTLYTLLCTSLYPLF